MDRRIQKTRAAIQTAYFDLLVDGKGRSPTVTDIARRANIDRKTFYLHYECVEDIVKGFCNDRIEELLTMLHATSFFKSPVHMEELFFALNTMMDRDMGLYRQLALMDSRNLFWGRVQEIMVQALTNAYAGAAKVSSREMTVYCDFFASGLIHVYQDYLRDPKQLKPEDLGRIVTDIAMHGAMSLFDTQEGKTE